TLWSMPASPVRAPRRSPGRSTWSVNTPTSGWPACVRRCPRSTSSAPKAPTCSSPQRSGLRVGTDLGAPAAVALTIRLRQDHLADPNRIRGDLDTLVLAAEFQRLLQRELA